MKAIAERRSAPAPRPVKGRVLAALPLAAVLTGGMVGEARAASHEQIVAACREQARPRVVACVQSKRGTASFEALVAACRASVGVPIVKACVQREEQRIAATKGAPPVPPKPAATPVATGAPSAAAVSLPPRTIADITGVLDKEKPDAAKIAALRDAADLAPPKPSETTDLAQFYYDRGNARAQLGRTKDALADGLQALEIGQRGLELRQMQRIRQFVAIQYRANGDLRKALEITRARVKDATDGNRGGRINASRTVAELLIAAGDIGQAETSIGQVAALVQEARGSPHPNWRKSYAIYGRSGLRPSAPAPTRRSGGFCSSHASFSPSRGVAFAPPARAPETTVRNEIDCQTLLLDAGVPVHVGAARDGRDPAVRPPAKRTRKGGHRVETPGASSGHPRR